MPKLFIITDRNVFRLYKKKFSGAEVIVIGAGEKIKTLGTVEYICKELLNRGADRTSFLLGVGGGVICDITGLTASVFMRGIGFGFVPTTLLAQADAAMGGKNGVNLNGYKNIVGVIKQPMVIFNDVSFLKTLSDKEYRNGLAEVIKHAVIKSPSLFKYLELHSDDILSRKKKALERMIRDSRKIKMSIVDKDLFEKKERFLLNFGHTYGHALETVSKGKISHGEAVSIGMVFAAKLSCLRGYIKIKDVLRIEKLILSYGLPVSSKLNAMPAIKKDKKKEGGKLKFVFIRGIGDAVCKYW